MHSRRYPHRITFRSPTDTVADSGQIKRTMADAFARWAKVIQTGGGQAQQDDQQQRTGKFEIKLRFSEAISTIAPDTWQIRCNLTGEILNIEHIDIDRSSRTWNVIITAALDR